jgi:hemerythrin-like domain-containing protein
MRHAILDRLHADHVNMAKVAALIAGELAAVETGGRADLGLLEDVMAYVTGHPDTHHHPTEDIVFARLKRTAPEACSEVDAIMDEHARVIARGREFLGLVRAVEEDAVVTRAELLAKGRRYLDTLSEHMNKEEAGLFRLAADRLDTADWAAIDARLAALEDPLFGATVAADYRRLWQRITGYPASG